MKPKPFSVDNLQDDISAVEAELAVSQKALLDLKALFSERYPSAPILLTRNPDSANGGLRWRYSRFYSKSGGRLAFHEIEAVLKKLPASIQGDWIGFEYERIRLNALVCPLFYRLNQLRKAQRQFDALEVVSKAV